MTFFFFCLEKGITTLDVADIYSDGRSESALGEVFRRHPGLRKSSSFRRRSASFKKEGKTVCYDFSKDYLLKAVDNCLSRLCVDHVDSLFAPQAGYTDGRGKKSAEAVSSLLEDKKILHFGVSNMDRSQIQYLEEFLPCPIEVDQLQLGLGQSFLLSGPLNVDNPVQARLKRVAFSSSSSVEELRSNAGLPIRSDSSKAPFSSIRKWRRRRNASRIFQRNTAFPHAPSQRVPLLPSARMSRSSSAPYERITSRRVWTVLLSPLEQEDWYRLYCSARKRSSLIPPSFRAQKKGPTFHRSSFSFRILVVGLADGAEDFHPLLDLGLDGLVSRLEEAFWDRIPSCRIRSRLAGDAILDRGSGETN